MTRIVTVRGQGLYIVIVWRCILFGLWVLRNDFVPPMTFRNLKDITVNNDQSADIKSVFESVHTNLKTQNVTLKATITPAHKL